MDWIPYDGSLEDLEEESLIHVGTQVRLQDGRIFLIGDLNTELGSCTCCCYSSEIITHYRQIPIPVDQP